MAKKRASSRQGTTTEAPPAPAGQQGLELRALTTEFAARARSLKILSIIVLVATALVILLGTLAFLFPTSWTDIGSVQKQLSEDIDGLRSNLDTIAEEQQEATLAQDLYNLYGVLYELKRRIDEEDDGQMDLGKTPVSLKRVTNAKTVAEMLVSAAPTQISLDISGYSYHRSTSTIVIPKLVFAKARDQINGRGMSVSGITADIDKLHEKLKSSEETEAAKKVAASLEKIFDLWKESEGDAESATRDLDEIQRNQVAVQRKIQDARDSITNTLLDAVAGGAASSQAVWVPQLTVRVGVVVLLLFLSAILFSTFRYILTLSAYYAARADALNLLSTQPGAQLDIGQLTQLIPHFSPDSYKIESVNVPYDKLGLPGS